MEGNKNLILKFRYILLLLPFFSFGQKLKGEVVDINNNPISNATIQIKSANEENTLSFTTSNSVGAFEVGKKFFCRKCFIKNFFHWL